MLPRPNIGILHSFEEEKLHKFRTLNVFRLKIVSNCGQIRICYRSLYVDVYNYLHSEMQ